MALDINFHSGASSPCSLWSSEGQCSEQALQAGLCSPLAQCCCAKRCQVQHLLLLLSVWKINWDFFLIYIYIYEQNGPCSHSCSLSKIFCHELVEKERFLAEIKGVTFKEGDSKKSGKDKRDVRICIGRSGEGRNRGRLHKCNVLGTYPSAL